MANRIGRRLDLDGAPATRLIDNTDGTHSEMVATTPGGFELEVLQQFSGGGYSTASAYELTAVTPPFYITSVWAYIRAGVEWIVQLHDALAAPTDASNLELWLPVPGSPVIGDKQPLDKQLRGVLIQNGLWIVYNGTPTDPAGFHVPGAAQTDYLIIGVVKPQP